jgi:hypothetical protein
MEQYINIIVITIAVISAIAAVLPKDAPWANLVRSLVVDVPKFIEALADALRKKP